MQYLFRKLKACYYLRFEVNADPSNFDQGAHTEVMLVRVAYSSLSINKNSVLLFMLCPAVSLLPSGWLFGAMGLVSP
jgi:hypothetical protein